MHNPGQASEMTMVEFGEMRDKQSQQRRRRADGAMRSVVDRSAVEENRALAPQAAQTTQRGAAVDRESPCAGRDSLDAAERGVWLHIWRTFLSELNERQQLKWSESFLDGSFAPAKKGAAESEKPSGVRGRSGWWWSTAAVFLWETTFTLHPRRKSNSRRRRSRRSA